ncbi:flagellar hook-length control protein FliK [Herminiimonas arsenitoxidans]|uniref:flagellar hook-length control protein FliK n=1 Tax=Herminiimonas arsenitoxidans TaxID=1809410 RepID=UPI000970C90C|nr:flagellar hook-length control protein FliK [Herminiimonas arsenitoxidans]
MNTSAVNSPLSVLQAPAPGNKQDASSTSDAGTFNQMLSREIAGRNNSGNSANEASKNAPKDSANNGDKTKTKSDANTAATPTEAAKTTDADKAAPVADGKTDETDTEPTTVSAELLAFVAALTQANTATAVTPAATAETDASVKLGKGTGLTTDTVADITLGAATTGAASTSEKDAIGKKSDFVSALDKATNAASDGKPAPAATKTDLEVAAAVVQTAKAIEPATVSNPQNVAALTTAALQQMNEAQGPQSNKLAPQVGTPDWNQALGQKVVWMVQGVQQSATLTLNPPDLGPMQVTLHVSNNQATANFTAHQPEVRHALEAAMPRLREMLNDAGIQLGQSNVSAGSPNQQGAFSEQRQGGPRQSNQADNAVDPALHVSHIPVSTAGTGIVDTFA